MILKILGIDLIEQIFEFQIDSIQPMARTKNKPVLKRSTASNDYIFQRAFLRQKNHKFISRYGS